MEKVDFILEMDSEDNSKVLVSIKYKNKIFGFGEVNVDINQLFQTDNVECYLILETINDFENREDSSELFKHFN